jgi:NADH:ubiquinone oxidoreductase subunit 4 (subunit M)
MSIIYLAFCWGDSIVLLGGILFCITHAFLSSLFFYLVDCLQRRYNTRSVVEISGILHLNPNLGICILISVVFYAGLPGTLKFISEFYIFSGLLECTPFSCLMLLYLTNFLGLIGFSKCWFNVVFGLTIKNQDKLSVDLTIKEFLIISFCVISLLFFNFFINLFF